MSDENDRRETFDEVCARLTRDHPAPFITSLVDISTTPETVVEEHRKTFRKVGDAVRAIRYRSTWTKDMGVGAYLRPELQARVLDAHGATVIRLVCVEVQTVEAAVCFGFRVFGPNLKLAELRWIPITEDAARKLLGLAAQRVAQLAAGSQERGEG